jgi:type IV pilus assembly protein PilM
VTGIDSISITLDKCSTAERAVEISVDRGGRRLRRYAQVGLPVGAVVDGEVVNDSVVTGALRRLWAEGGFSSTKVVLGVSGHRVIVRQADVPALDEEDLRSALRFDAQELIPIPMDQASFDFSVLDRRAGVDADGRSLMRILIVAAHRDLLRSYLSVLKGAGLEAVAIDATPLALMRVVPFVPGSAGDEGVEALVSIGAEMTTVAVRQNGVPRFIRSLAVGGAKLTAGIAAAMHVEPAVAERLKRGAVPDGSPQVVQARRAITADLRDLADEVKATVDFFVAQSDGVPVARLLVTGGAAQTRGVVEALAGGMSAEVQLIDPFAAFNLDELALDESQTDRARASAATAVGLALWTFDAPGVRLSVLPEEVVAARRARRLAAVAAAGVVGVALLLGVATTGQILAVHHARDQVDSTQQEVNTLQAKVNSLQSATAVHGKVQARQALVVAALTGDIDWVRVLGQLASVMPPQLSLTSFGGTRAVAVTGTSSSASAPGVGILTFSVTGKGGLPVVAGWLEGLQRDHSLEGTWVSSVSEAANGGSVTFTSSAYLTSLADSNRAQAVKR